MHVNQTGSSDGTPTRNWWARTAFAAGVALTISSCVCYESTSAEDGSAAGQMEVAPEATTEPTHPEAPLTIEESDLLKLDDTTLYVLNARTGLHVIDVSDPRSPERVTQVEALAGANGELYVHDPGVITLVENPSVACGRRVDIGDVYSGTVAVTALGTPSTTPAITATTCLPGTLISSRLVGDVLYAVTTQPTQQGDTTWVFSLDVSESGSLAPVETVELNGTGHEIHVTDEFITVAQPSNGGTRVRFVDIESGDGSMVERGSLQVAGEPMGRFHMDAYGDTFRVVTRNSASESTALHVIDVSSPDSPRLLSSLPDLAQGEELFATRFDGEKVYVVTYEPAVVTNTVVSGGNDPLWVISLADPAEPRVLGELHIPGWSDFIFPRGDRLLAVGRGTSGDRVAASLYDVADPAQPVELRRLEFGDPSATSEASSDFRGVTVVEEQLGATPLLVVPYSNNLMTTSGCVPEHYLQLIDLDNDDLRLRAKLQQAGRVLRTLPVGGELYALSTKQVTSSDVAERGDPAENGHVVLDDSATPDACVLPPAEPTRQETVWVGGGEGDDNWTDYPCGCSVADKDRPCREQYAWWLLALGVWIGGRRLVRGPRRSAEAPPNASRRPAPGKPARCPGRTPSHKLTADPPRGRRESALARKEGRKGAC